MASRFSKGVLPLSRSHGSFSAAEDFNLDGLLNSLWLAVAEKRSGNVSHTLLCNVDRDNELQAFVRTNFRDGVELQFV